MYRSVTGDRHLFRALLATIHSELADGCCDDWKRVIYTFIVNISISEPSCRDRLLCRWQQTFSKIKINKFPKPLKPVKTVEVVMGVEALPGKGLPKPWKVEKPLDYRIDRMNEWMNERINEWMINQSTESVNCHHGNFIYFNKINRTFHDCIELKFYLLVLIIQYLWLVRFAHWWHCILPTIIHETMDTYYNTDVHTVLVVCNTRMMLKCMQYDYCMSKYYFSFWQQTGYR